MMDMVSNAPVEKRGEEKRASPRRPLRCRVKVICPKGTIDGESFDLSSGGIGVILDHQLMLGDICTVMFAPFRDGSVKSVTVSARVAFCMLNTAGYRTGFEFRNVAADTAAVINNLLAGAASLPTR